MVLRHRPRALQTVLKGVNAGEWKSRAWVSGDVITQAVDEVVVRIGVLRYGYLIVNDQDVFMAIIRVKWGYP